MLKRADRLKFDPRPGLQFQDQILGGHDPEQGVEGVFPVQVQALGVGCFGKSSGAVFQDHGFKIMAEAVHGCGEDAETGSDAGHGAEGDILVFQDSFKTGIKKG